MSNINKSMVLNTMIKHETLTIVDLAKKENLGMIPDKFLLDFLLGKLLVSRHIDILNGVTPITYTITDKGIAEGIRLNLKG